MVSCGFGYFFFNNIIFCCGPPVPRFSSPGHSTRRGGADSSGRLRPSSPGARPAGSERCPPLRSAPPRTELAARAAGTPRSATATGHTKSRPRAQSGLGAEKVSRGLCFRQHELVAGRAPTLGSRGAADRSHSAVSAHGPASRLPTPPGSPGLWPPQPRCRIPGAGRGPSPAATGGERAATSPRRRRPPLPR